MPMHHVCRGIVPALLAVALLVPTSVGAAQRGAPIAPVVARQPARPRLPTADPSCGSWITAPEQATGFTAISAAGPNDVWAVGTAGVQSGEGVTAHWDGAHWTIVPSENPSPTTNRLYGVAAISADDVWAVGQTVTRINPATSGETLISRPLLEHWDGTRWSLVAAPLPNKDYYPIAVTAISSTDVWAVGIAGQGPGPIILHWDGHTWHNVPGAPLGQYGGALFGVSATASNDVWAVGSANINQGAALIEHWDGREWRTSPVPPLSSEESGLMSIAAFSSTDAWAVGYADSPTTYGVVDPVIVHWDGAHWRSVQGVATQNGLGSVTAISARDVWATGDSLIEHWDGAQWQATSVPAGGLRALAATGPEALWGVGAYFQHRTGPVCNAVTAPETTIALANLGIQNQSARGSGDGPGAIVLAGGPNRAVVRDQRGAVEGIDVARHTIVWHANPSASGAMTTDAGGDRVFVPSSKGPSGGSVQLLDAATGRSIRALNVHAVPFTVAFDTSHNHLVVAEPSAVQVLDAGSGATIATVPISNPTSLAIDEQTGKVFVATSVPTQIPGMSVVSGSTSVTVLDAASGAVVARLPGLGGVLALDEPAGSVIAGGVEISSTTATIQVSEIDAASGRLRRTYSLGSDGDAFLGNMVVDTATDQVFAATFFGLQALDLTTGEVQIVSKEATSALAVDAGTGRLYAVQVNTTDHYGNPLGPGSVSVFEVAGGTRLATNLVGTGPDAMLLDPSSGQVIVLDQRGVDVVGPGLGTLVAAGPTSPADPAPKVPGDRYFPSTQHNLGGAFLDFWRRYGGLDLLGAPLTEPFLEGGHLVQYTERTLLQDINGQVTPAPLGRQLTTGRIFPPTPAPAPAPGGGQRYFAKTGHTLTGRFLAYWQTDQGAVLLGAPISEVVTEGNGDGSERRYATQWFENGRLEYHPEQTNARYSVEVGLVGLQALRRQSWLPGK